VPFGKISGAENNFAEFASSIRTRRTPNATRRRAAYLFRKGCKRGNHAILF